MENEGLTRILLLMALFFGPPVFKFLLRLFQTQKAAPLAKDAGHPVKKAEAYEGPQGQQWESMREIDPERPRKRKRRRSPGDELQDLGSLATGGEVKLAEIQHRADVVAIQDSNLAGWRPEANVLSGVLFSELLGPPKCKANARSVKYGRPTPR